MEEDDDNSQMISRYRKKGKVIDEDGWTYDDFEIEGGEL